MARYKKPDFYNDAIIDEILGVVNGERNKDQQKRANKIKSLISCLNYLFTSIEENLMQHQLVYGKEIFKDFEFIASFRKSNTKENEKQKWVEALNIELEILDLLRGHDSTIIIQKTTQTGNITQYVADEAKIKKQGVESFNEKNNRVTKEVQYLIGETKNLLANEKDNDQKNKSIEAFKNHYRDFYQAVLNLLGSPRCTLKEASRETINEGHVVEAFYRHVYYTHGIENFEDNTNYNFTDKFTSKEEYSDVAKNLYFSLGNDPWWIGGDIDYFQIKANENKRIASVYSIRVVAAKLLSIFTMPNYNFTRKDFERIFTPAAVEDMSGISGEEALDLIKKDKNLYGINFNYGLVF